MLIEFSTTCLLAEESSTCRKSTITNGIQRRIEGPSNYDYNGGGQL